MQALTYRCPYCKTTVDVTPDRVHEAVICPNPDCKRPFELEAPVAKLVGSRELAPEDKVEVQVAQPTADREEILTVAHPAMGRARPFTFLLFGLLLITGTVGAAWCWSHDQLPGAYASAAVALFALVCFAIWKLRMHATRLTITTRRTLLKRGLLGRHTCEVLHEDVHLLNIEQSAFQRLFNVGSIAISSAAGQSEPEIQVQGMPRPHDLVAPIRKQQER
jgi:membrane protein YdbS with pleckstrin-like domain